MALDQIADRGNFRRGLKLLDADHLEVDALGEVASLIQHVADAAGHAGTKVAACGAENDDAAARHVFAAVVTDALDDGADAGVADGEALPGHAADVDFAGSGAVERHVADGHVLLGLERGGGGRIDDDLAAREALADVVVGVALDGKGHAPRHEGAEALAGGTLEADADRVIGQALGAVLLGDLVAGDRADHAVDVPDRQLGNDLFAALDGRLTDAEERREVEGLVEPVVLLGGAEAADLGADLG